MHNMNASDSCKYFDWLAYYNQNLAIYFFDFL